MTILRPDFAAALQSPGPRPLRDLAIALCAWDEAEAFADLQCLGIEASVALGTHKVRWHRLSNQASEVKAYLEPSEGDPVGRWYVNPATHLREALTLAVERSDSATVHILVRSGSYRACVRSVPLTVTAPRPENAVLALALMLEWRKVDERAFLAFLTPGGRHGQTIGNRIRPGMVPDVWSELGGPEQHGGGSSPPSGDGSRGKGGAGPIGDVDSPSHSDGGEPE
jgi:hypothetical protein